MLTKVKRVNSLVRAVKHSGGFVWSYNLDSDLFQIAEFGVKLGCFQRVQKYTHDDVKFIAIKEVEGESKEKYIDQVVFDSLSDDVKSVVLKNSEVRHSPKQPATYYDELFDSLGLTE